jgi:ankyrin repeat protein
VPLFLLLLAALAAEGKVLTYNEAGRQRITSSLGPGVVKFDPLHCTQGCGAIDAFWEQAAEFTPGKVWRADCAKQDKVCSAHKIRGREPVFEAWDGNRFTRYSGAKDLPSLLAWVQFSLKRTSIAGGQKRAVADHDQAVELDMTPLHAAAFSGDLKTVKAMLKPKKGAGKESVRIDARNRNGATPLCLAAQYGHIKVVKALLKAGADKDASDRSGATPLLAATLRNHAAVVAMLLTQDASVDKAEQRAFSLLELARARGYAKVTQVLIDKGVTVESAELRRLALRSCTTEQGFPVGVQVALCEGNDVRMDAAWCELGGCVSPARNRKHHTGHHMATLNALDFKACPGFGYNECVGGAPVVLQPLGKMVPDLIQRLVKGGTPSWRLSMGHTYHTPGVGSAPIPWVQHCPKGEDAWRCLFGHGEAATVRVTDAAFCGRVCDGELEEGKEEDDDDSADEDEDSDDDDEEEVVEGDQSLAMQFAMAHALLLGGNRTWGRLTPGPGLPPLSREGGIAVSVHVRAGNPNDPNNPNNPNTPNNPNNS